jgi:hypothetical protein
MNDFVSSFYLMEFNCLGRSITTATPDELALLVRIYCGLDQLESAKLAFKILKNQQILDNFDDLIMYCELDTRWTDLTAMLDGTIISRSKNYSDALIGSLLRTGHIGMARVVDSVGSDPCFPANIINTAYHPHTSTFDYIFDGNIIQIY